MKIVKIFHIPISYIFQEISRQTALLFFIWVGPGRFIALNDSASPRMVINMYFNFFPFFYFILELFECPIYDC